jgi:hypothetical protein
MTTLVFVAFAWSARGECWLGPGDVRGVEADDELVVDSEEGRRRDDSMRRMARVASWPFITGIEMSIRMTLGADQLRA